MFTLWSTGNAQPQPKYYHQWFFGGWSGLDFLQNPVQRTVSSLTTLEGSASICDPITGKVLFYTNGEQVWNRDDRIMPNGNDLLGSYSSTQSALIIPLPGSDDVYYIFTADAGPYLSRLAGINYSIVDMKADGGLGDVVTKNELLLKPATEKLVGVQHCNGRDFWIVGHELYNNRFVAWKLTEDGIVNTVYSDVGKVYNSPSFAIHPEVGYLKASPNGRYLYAAMVGSFGELLEFDNNTGEVLRSMIELPSYYGASFSPNNLYLYIADTTRTITQYIVEPPSGLTVADTRTVIASPDTQPDAFQIGPDGNIYVSLARRIGIIQNPNQANASFRDSVFGSIDPFVLFAGLPNCIDAFLGDSDVSPIHDGVEVLGNTSICRGDSTQLHVTGGYAYQWSPSIGLSCDDCADPVISPDSTTTYTIWYNNGSCQDPKSLQVRVVVDTPPDVDAGENVRLCHGDSVQLQGKSDKAVFYQWSPSTSLSCDDCIDPVATPNRSTMYYLKVRTAGGCENVDSVFVDITNAEMSVSADTVICLGQEVQLLGTGREQYRWSPANGLSCTDCPNPIASPLQTTEYVVEGSTDGRCIVYDTVIVTVQELPIADAGADNRICLGDSVALQASGGSQYSWTPVRSLSCLDCPDPIAYPTTTTTYHVRVTNAFGCIAWDSVTVTVENNGSVLATGDTAFCAGGTAQIFAEGAASYRWTPTIGLSCEDCPDPQATPTETTTYYVLGSNTNGGCPAVDSVTVVVHDFPIAEAGEGGAVCSGESIELNASGGARYRWDASVDLSCEDCPDPQATPTETRTYYVTVWNAEGCSSRDSVEVVVHPSLVVVAGEDQMICSGESVALRAEGGVRWEWSPAEGLSCTDCPNPEATPNTTTMYRVRAWSAEGCEAEDSVEVQVREEVEVIRLRIGRNYRGATGEELVLPIEVVEGFGETDISELELRLTYDPAIMRLDKESFARLLVGTALEGWSVEVVAFTRGEASVRLVAPEGEVLTASSPLLRFAARLYLSNVRSTELAFSITSNSTCYAIETTPGYAEVDSICGLSFRLIESTVAKYVAPVAYPNPASDRMQFEFGLGLDGRAVLEVFDMQGGRVGLLVDSELASGQYSVEWDVRGMKSGLYWYRLRSGDWIKSGQVRIQK